MSLKVENIEKSIMKWLKKEGTTTSCPVEARQGPRENMQAVPRMGH